MARADCFEHGSLAASHGGDGCSEKNRPHRDVSILAEATEDGDIFGNDLHHEGRDLSKSSDISHSWLAA